MFFFPVNWLKSMIAHVVMARYQTPPPKARPFSPTSPNRLGEVTVALIMVNGNDLGQLKVQRSARLIDLYDRLMSALGGSLGYAFEPRLVTPGGEPFDTAYQQPFADATDGDTYSLLKAPLKDTAYLDRDRRSKK